MNTRPPSTLYKYRPLNPHNEEDCKKIKQLFEGNAFFNSPLNFNDPIDSLVPINMAIQICPLGSFPLPKWLRIIAFIEFKCVQNPFTFLGYLTQEIFPYVSYLSDSFQLKLMLLFKSHKT